MVSIRRRFNIAFLLLVFLPALAVSVVLSRLYLSALFATVSRQTEELVDQMAQNIRGEADEVSILASALVHDLELRAMADRYARANGPGERLLASSPLDDKLVSFFTYSNRVGAVSLYMKRGGVYSYSNYPNIRSIGGIDRSVYADALRDPGKVFLLDSLTGVAGNIGEKFMLSVAVCPGPEEYGTQLDAILVMFRVPYFDRLMSRAGDLAAEGVVIFGRDGWVLLSSFPDSSGAERIVETPRTGPSGFRAVRFKGRSWLASSLRMESTGWTIVFLADRALMTGRITSYQWYLYPALALLTVLFMVYAGIFLSRIANPIREVISSMGRVGGGDYSVRVPAQGIEELALLTESFNRMVDEIRRLTREREERERERLRGELEALRFQINPHFVSNTLNSIRLMALAANAGSIAEMTQSLMRVLSDSYASVGPLTDLSHEISNLRSYVDIMKVRFGEHFDAVYRIQEGTGDVFVLRMILQPVVENAILHGISGSGRRGTIEITSRLVEAPGPCPKVLPEAGIIAVAGRHLVIEVHDDGVGMEPERAASALAGLAAGGRSSDAAGGGGLHRIGLDNVQRRIRLNFGEPFGLTLESEQGRFTRVRFLLPVLRRGDGTRA